MCVDEIAHALERGADPQRAHHDAEVAGDRLLPGEDRDRELVERGRRLVDAGVLGDDLLREAHVRFVERPRRLLDRDGDELGDLDESVLHLAQFLLEHLTHVEILVCSVPRRKRTRAHRSDPAPDILPAAG